MTGAGDGEGADAAGQLIGRFADAVDAMAHHAFLRVDRQTFRHRTMARRQSVSVRRNRNVPGFDEGGIGGLAEMRCGGGQ